MEAKEGIAIRGDKIGKRANDWYVWVHCIECGRGRWILRWKLKLPNFTGLCCVCSARRNTNRAEAVGDRHPRWNNGQTMYRGYMYIANENHPAKTSRGYVKRARLVLEEKLGRYLLPNCVPHHINGIKHDDRPSNLSELTKAQHATIHAFERNLKAKAKSLGRKEVVEYLKKHSTGLKIHRAMPSKTSLAYSECHSWEVEHYEWQAKLKEWGL